MTRKKSNVKALVLAITYTILAGGYSGLNPVYAGDVSANFNDATVNGTVTGSTSGSFTGTASGTITISGSEIGTALDGVDLSKALYGSGEDATLANLAKNVSTNATNISTVNGKITNINTDITDLKQSTGNLETEILTLQQMDAAARQDIINLQKKTAGISDNGDEITTNSLKLKETNFQDTQEVTAAKVKGYDLAVTAIGSQFEDGSLLHKTQGITYDSASKKTIVSGTLQVIDTQGASASLMVGENTLNAEQLGRITGAISKAQDGSTTISGKLSGSYGSKIGNVTFNEGGKISGVQDINDGFVKIQPASTDNNKTALQVNGVLELNDNTLGSARTATLTLDGLSKLNNLVKNGASEKTVIYAGNGSEVGGVKFDDGTVGGIKGIKGYLNDNTDITFGYDNNLNHATTIEDTVQISAKSNTMNGNYGKVAINDGQKNQVIIGEEGIVVGKNSSVVNDDGVFTGGHDYDSAKAAMRNSDGAIKGANGKFTVDKDGKVVSEGTLKTTGDISTDGNLTAKGSLSAADGKFTVDGATGNTVVGGTLNSKGNFSVGDNDEFTVDATNGNVVSKGKITSASAKIGAVEIANDGTITGVKAITTDTLTVTNGFSTNGNIQSASLNVTGNATVGGNLGVTGTVNGATITSTTFNGATIDATHFNDVTLSSGNVTATGITGTTITGTTVTDGAGASMNAGTVKGTTITDGVASMNQGNLTGVKDITATGNVKTNGTVQGTTLTDGVASMNGGKVTAKNGLEVDANNQLTNEGLKTSDINATKAQIGNIKIEGEVISSTTANGIEIEEVKINNGNISDVDSINGVKTSGNTASGLTVGSGATAVTIGGNSLALSSIGFSVDADGDVSGKSFTAGASSLKAGELKLNDANVWTTAEGIKAEKAAIGANTLNANGISTTGTLGVAGKATFGTDTANSTTVEQGKVSVTQNGGTTTIEGGTITTNTLDVKDIILHNEMKDGAGNTITIKGSDGSISVAGDKFQVDAKGQLTNEFNDKDISGKTIKTTLKTSVDGINANYTNAENHNNNLLNIDKNGVALGVQDTANTNLGMFSANATSASIGFGSDNSVVVDAKTITSKLGTDITRTMTNSTEQSIVDKVKSASRSITATEIVDSVGDHKVTTNSDGTRFGNGTTQTTIDGSSILSQGTSGAGRLNGAELNLFKDATHATYTTAGGVTFIDDDSKGVYGGNKTTIQGGIISTDTLNVSRINLGGEILDKDHASNGQHVADNSALYMDDQGNFLAASGNFTVKGGTGTDRGAMKNTVGDTTNGQTVLETKTDGANMSFEKGGVKSEVSVGNDSAKISSGASSIEVKDDGITNNGKTTFTGAVDSTVATDKTTIDGNTIKTGHLITDKLTITGQGNAGGTFGSGSDTGKITLAGDGSFQSNVKVGAQETDLTTDKDGVHAKVTDGTSTAANNVTATSIGGVITNGTVEMAKTELTKDGFKVSQKDYTDVNIANGDVSVTNKQTGKQVNLSDLGTLGDLNDEITSREEYKQNSTAVGAINSVSGRLTDEVNRLDGRINDVSDRVNKVGAMAAAIASLKSIGYDPQAPSEFSIGLGQYKGETGVAMGFFHYPNKNFMINVSLSTAGGETMGGIGATWRFGHKSPQKLLDEQREAQAKKELAAAEKYQAAAKLAKEAQERAEYAAKLARQAQVSADNAKAAADATQAKHF